jgi:hypothetical protein
MPSPTIEASPRASTPADAPRAGGRPVDALSAADFAATLRQFTDDEGDRPSLIQRFARLNMALRTERSPYADSAGSRTWWAW